MTRLPVVLGCALAITLATELPAQRPQARSGFWYAFGLGTGWARVACQICRADHRPGVSAQLRLGGGLSRSVLIGAELAAWDRSANGVDETLAALSAAAYWYPARRSPLYLKGGVGFSTHRAEDGTNVITSTGLGPQMGIGYELRVGSNLFLAPFFNVAYGSVAGGVKFNGTRILDQATVTLVQIGVALTGH